MKDYSQDGESTILKNIFDVIGTVNKYGVEFGAWDGFHLSNLRMFLEMGWAGLQLDSRDMSDDDTVKNEFITKDNVNLIFDKYKVPKIFDLLSIDIDGNDYWVWKNLDREPNVVIIEYNCHFSHDESYVLNYKEDHVYNGTYAYSASLTALEKLGKEKGYYLYAESAFNNLIFVKENFYDLLNTKYKKENVNLPKEMHKRELADGVFFVEV